jgi:hypothetical protein
LDKCNPKKRYISNIVSKPGHVESEMNGTKEQAPAFTVWTGVTLSHVSMFRISAY